MKNERLISVDALMRKICGAKCGCEYEDCGREGDCIFDYFFSNAPSVDAVQVVHGRWVLEAHKERANCRWNVTAECSECHNEPKEIWAGFFPGVPDWWAKDIALDSAGSVKISNYCPNCGAKMDGERKDNG